MGPAKLPFTAQAPLLCCLALVALFWVGAQAGPDDVAYNPYTGKNVFIYSYYLPKIAIGVKQNVTCTVTAEVSVKDPTKDVIIQTFLSPYDYNSQTGDLTCRFATAYE
ncbi:hypothetical protein HDU88_007892, partial [Geranomyces variabilis]